MLWLCSGLRPWSLFCVAGFEICQGCFSGMLQSHRRSRYSVCCTSLLLHPKYPSGLLVDLVSIFEAGPCLGKCKFSRLQCLRSSFWTLKYCIRKVVLQNSIFSLKESHPAYKHAPCCFSYRANLYFYSQEHIFGVFCCFCFHIKAFPLMGQSNFHVFHHPGDMWAPPPTKIHATPAPIHTHTPGSLSLVY